jgi:hypothetical protein
MRWISDRDDVDFVFDSIACDCFRFQHSPNACLTTSGSGGDLDGSFSSSERSDPITDQFVTKKGLIFKTNSNKKKEKVNA